jgi:predicted nuclease of predicted toxin-antitoxin system
LRLLLDMNLAPRWVELHRHAGHEAVHWASVGDPGAADAELMRHVREHGFVVLTHDLDFGDILASTGGTAPSVVHIRGDDLAPERIGAQVLRALEQCSAALGQGALVSIDLYRHRLRMLPLAVGD